MGESVRRILKRAAAALLFLLLFAVLGLAILEGRRERRLTSRYAPPGEMISVGTHRLHLHCRGSGSPPVLLDAGSGLAYLNWHPVQTGLTSVTTVCSYDRSGLGWSETGPAEPSANQATTELSALLEGSGISGPWILVGHSLGGLYAQQFLNLYRDKVAAVVLLDAPHEELYEREPLYMEQVTPRFVDFLLPHLASLGFHRWSRPTVPESDPSWVGWQLHATAKHVRQAAAEWWAIPKSARQVVESRTDWGDTPLVVIQAGRLAFPKAWSDSARSTVGLLLSSLHQELAARSTRGTYRLLEDSGHGIPWEHPEVVIAVVDSIVHELR